MTIKRLIIDTQLNPGFEVVKMVKQLKSIRIPMNIVLHGHVGFKASKARYKETHRYQIPVTPLPSPPFYPVVKPSRHLDLILTL
jgi:hypothetical protein